MNNKKGNGSLNVAADVKQPEPIWEKYFSLIKKKLEKKIKDEEYYTRKKTKPNKF